MRPVLSRRQMLRGAAVGAVSVAGVAALAACGESQVVEPAPAAAPAAPAAPAAAAAAAPAAAAAAPVAERVKFEFVTDHVSGVRGKSTKWALEKYAQFRPNVDIKFTPQAGDFVEAFAIQLAAGTAPESALLGWGFFGSHQESFTQINDVLDKHPDFNGDDLIFEPDSYTINYDLGYPFTDQWSGAAFGLPYQGNVSGHQYNINLYEQMGVEAPGETWTYANEWLEATKRTTDVDDDIWGTKYGGGGSPHEWTPIGWGHGGQQFISPDGTHTSVFDDGGDKGFRFILDLIHKHKVSPPVGAQKELSGEFGDPFSAGKVAAQLGRGDAKGNTVTRIKDRFRWSLAPQPLGDVTGTVAVHRTNQGHYVLGSAARRGNVEAVTDFLVWMAGPTMQARAATDRGFLPCRWDALESPENLAAPPERQDLLKTFVQGEFRTWQGYHPNWEEWLAWRGIANKGTLGDVTADEAMEEAIAVGDRILAQGIDLLEERKAKWGSTA